MYLDLLKWLTIWQFESREVINYSSYYRCCTNMFLSPTRASTYTFLLYIHPLKEENTTKRNQTETKGIERPINQSSRWAPCHASSFLFSSFCFLFSKEISERNLGAEGLRRLWRARTEEGKEASSKLPALRAWGLACGWGGSREPACSVVWGGGYFEAKQAWSTCRRFGGLRGLSELAAEGVSVGGEVTAWPPLLPLTTPFTPPAAVPPAALFRPFPPPAALPLASVLFLSQTNPGAAVSPQSTPASDDPACGFCSCGSLRFRTEEDRRSACTWAQQGIRSAFYKNQIVPVCF